jgi:Domain of unknown function (DUF4388)
MFDTRKTLHNGGVLDVIKILSANGESGRLEINVGKTQGAFFFKNGQLVDARVGDLTGFRAVNAVASMRDARFTFDPSIIPPVVSSITPNERVVLKQFFGIQTIDPDQATETPAYSDEDEVTLEMHKLPIPVVPEPAPLPVLPEPVPDTPSAPRSFYRVGLVLAMLFVLIAVGAVALRNKYREREQALASVVTPAVAPAMTPAAAPVATPVVMPKVKAPRESPATVVAKEVKAEPSVVARDLTGKWNVVNSVQKTSYRSFQNMNIGFELTISQSGKTFTGEGRKVSENGHSLPATSRTPIQVKGSIDGDRVEATFIEAGALRKTNGRFVWRINQAGGGLNGTFLSTAAGSSGKSAATRQL